MNYKLSTYVLAIALIAGIVYHVMKCGADSPEGLSFMVPLVSASGEENFDTVNVTKETVEEFNKLLRHDDFIHFDEQDVIDFWKDSTRRFDSTRGTAFTPAEARKKMDEFNTWNETTGNFIREIVPHGFALGKNRLRQMLHQIDSINKAYPLPDSSKMIYGIRINLAVGKDPKAKRKNMDIMIIPIKNNGRMWTDYPKLRKTKTGASPLFLDTSSPCPTMCN